ncbi:MAG: hypothetical protein JNK79_02545 [Chitinophagaceae bacterium]|nr:hypothetical protein [Chitinophagaceae bacterium]
MNTPVFILINRNCCQGKGWKKWNAVRDQVLKRLPGAEEVVTENADEMHSRLSGIVKENDESRIISAGGDGSIHALINALLDSGQNSKHIVGAIGLGSSNDFLKPFKTFIGDVPVRVNTSAPPVYQDAGKIGYTDANGIERQKYFIVNASVGVTAEGNWHFNHPGFILKWLKKNNTSAAITFAALKAIFTYRNKTVIARFNGDEKSIVVSNINLLKIPYVAGSLHYKQPILPDDGKLGVNMCVDMSRIELFKTLLQLERGNFAASEKRLSAMVNCFELSSSSPLVFECDGETSQSSSIKISVAPKAIRLLAS